MQEIVKEEVKKTENPHLGAPLKEQRPIIITNFQTTEATKHATAVQLLG
jgi:hypothetical protein